METAISGGSNIGWDTGVGTTHGELGTVLSLEKPHF